MCVLVFERGLMLLGLLVFFFQAEDGIRDLVRSRGLGDVYKRQVAGHSSMAGWPRHRGRAGFGRLETMDPGLVGSGTVSYTHLTLPTSDLV